MTSSQQGATTLQCLDDFYVVDSDESFLSPLSVVACWCLEQYRRTPFPLLSLSEYCVASNRHYDICLFGDNARYCAPVRAEVVRGFLFLFFRTLTYLL